MLSTINLQQRSPSRSASFLKGEGFQSGSDRHSYLYALLSRSTSRNSRIGLKGTAQDSNAIVTLFSIIEKWPEPLKLEVCVIMSKFVSVDTYGGQSVKRFRTWVIGQSDYY